MASSAFEVREVRRGAMARRVLAITVAALIGFLVAGCASGEPPSIPPPTATAPSARTMVPSLSPQPTPPQPTATPIPTAPGDLERMAATQRNGIEVQVELQRNPMPAGEPSWIKVTVTNRGRNDVTWAHDGCAMPAGVHGTSGAAWPMGQDHSAGPGMFKTYALGGSIVEEPSPFATFDFVPQELLGRGSSGCADLGLAEIVKPGRSLRQTIWWSGFTTGNRALPPAGSATLSVVAGLYYRGGQETPIEEANIKLTVGAWINASDDARRLSPAEIVDAALADQEFARYVETQDIGNGRDVIAWYQPNGDTWEVGILPWHETEPPRIHGVVVDALRGTILGPLDREWSRDVDGFP